MSLCQLCARFREERKKKMTSTFPEITQQQIDETRTIPESKMLQDLKYLLTEGHSLNYFDQQGATPVRTRLQSDWKGFPSFSTSSSPQMHVAAASGYNTVAEFLLKQQIPTDTEDKDGWQAIHIAAFWGHVSCLTHWKRAPANMSSFLLYRCSWASWNCSCTTAPIWRLRRRRAKRCSTFAKTWSCARSCTRSSRRWTR